MSYKNLTGVFLASILLSCSYALDFDDIANLPCDCLPEYVCLKGSDQCVPQGSVEDFKFCTPDAVDPDALCQGGSKCIDLDGNGNRCLPPCTITNYSTPNTGQRVRDECPTGTLCWETERGGYCSEGECSEIRQDCPITQQCVAVNGAGKCFTTCNIFDGRDACGGNDICHLLLDSNVTSCVSSGSAIIGQICDDATPCAKFDTSTGVERPMICAKPIGSDDNRRCQPICVPGNSSAFTCKTEESCQLVATNVDAVTGANLGICK